MSFVDKVTIVTGGTSGIGLATAMALLREGAKVVVASRNPERADHAFKELSQKNSLLSVCADVAQEKEVEALIDKTVSHFGVIDFLVNNAGISGKTGPQKKFLWETPTAEWDHAIAVNLTGAFLCCRYAVPHMIKRGKGAIVNVASLAAKTGPEQSSCGYVASKAGMVGLTKILAREVSGYGIRVNAVAPGRIETSMKLPPEMDERFKKIIPLKRIGKAEEVADGILYLLSDASSYITGGVIGIDGGYGMYW